METRKKGSTVLFSPNGKGSEVSSVAWCFRPHESLHHEVNLYVLSYQSVSTKENKLGLVRFVFYMMKKKSKLRCIEYFWVNEKRGKINNDKYRRQIFWIQKSWIWYLISKRGRKNKLGRKILNGIFGKQMLAITSRFFTTNSVISIKIWYDKN